MDRIDLHAHTTHSDGSLTPSALVDLAAEIGLRALAITDHDTVSGLEEARRRGAARGVEILTGCEITTTIDTGVVHVLAYAFGEEERDLLDFLALLRRGREVRNARILARLEDLGLPLTEAQVRQQASGSVVGRPHIAMALVAAGHADSVGEAFHNWLKDGARAFVRPELPPPEEAIDQVRRAGGVSVIAHPRQMRLGGIQVYRRLFRRWKQSGLAGVEVDHPSHDATHRRAFRALADELGLVASGGSDFHGSMKPHVRLGEGDGTISVAYETWEALRRRAGA